MFSTVASLLSATSRKTLRPVKRPACRLLQSRRFSFDTSDAAGVQYALQES
jgi:hypothetical protein